MPLFTILHVVKAGKRVSQACCLPVYITCLSQWLYFNYRMGPTTQLNNLFVCVLNYLLAVLFYLLRVRSFGIELLNDHETTVCGLAISF